MLKYRNKSVIFIILTLFFCILMTGAVSAATPSANFTADDNWGVDNVTVQFNDTSSGSPTSWTWDFGDNGTSTEQNPTHTYTAVGNYTVSLTSSNADGSDTIIKSNYISVLNNVTQFANYRGTNIYVANDNGVKYDVENGVVATNSAGISYIYVPDSYFVSFRQDGGGLNPIHISTSNTGYQVTTTTSQNGTFYITFTGGQPTMPEAILMLAINGTVSDDFSVHITSSGYTWTMNVPAVGNDFTTNNLTYVVGALNETFDKSDLIYISYYKLCSSFPYPIYEGQVMTDTNDTFLIMFIDLYAGCLQTGIDNGALKVDYSFTGLTSNNTAVFNVYGWYSASNHGTGIIMTNSLTGGDSGYTVQGVDSAPVASFSTNSTSGNVPLSVQFTDTSSGNPTSWAWDFNGDGVVDSTEQNPIYTYTTPGTYNVSLTVFNVVGDNTQTLTSYITVNNGTEPVVNATPDAGIYNSTQTVTLTSDQPDSTIYYTTDGSDPTDTSNSNRVPYSNPIPINTTTTLNFAAVNTGGVWSSRYNKTYVIDSSTPTVTANPEGGDYNSAQSVTLTTVDLDTNATTYYTTDGTDPKSSGSRVVYSTPIGVDTSVTLLYAAVDEAGNWSPVYSQTYNVTIATPPVANFTTNATSGAAPLSVQFNDTSSGSPTSWLWDFGDNTASTEQNPTHTYTNAGIYTVTLTAINAAGNNTLTRSSLISVFLNDAYVSPTGNDTSGNGSEANPYATIQKALDNVVSGGIVHLLAGTYTATGNYALTISKNVNFVGADQTTTIIDAAGLGSIFTINSGVTVSIVNLTFENGKVNSAIYNNGNLNLSNCTFTNNTASLGGAIYNNYGTLISLNGCTFNGNTATGAGLSSSGGAIYNNYGSIISLNGCTFNGNTAASGGAICNYNGNIATLNNCSFINNTASASSVGGGAIYNRAGNITSVINSTFIGNTATSSSGIGGAIFNYAGNNIITTVSGCNFLNNSAGSAGGAISNSATISTITNCSFTNNTSKNGGAVRNSGTVNILSCIFSSNSASTTGGAIYTGTSTTTVHLSSFVNNTAPTGSAIYRTSGTVNAQNNWWGSNSDPSSQIYGTVDFSNWLYMTETIVPTTVANGTTAVVTVSFNKIWNGSSVVSIDPASGHIVDGTQVTFTSDLGTFSPVTATTTNGIATTTFTATNDIIGAINTTTNSQTVSYLINRLASVISVGNVTGVSGETTNLTANLTDGNGTGISGQNVTVTVNGTSYTATTDGSGLATVVINAPSGAGVYTVTASFDGDLVYQDSSNNGTSYLTVQLRDAYVSPTGSDTSGDGSSSNPFATIQKALDNTVTGGTVHLKAGTYTGTGNTELTITKNVTITGDDQATTVIDAQNSTNIFTINSGITVTLTNLTLTNGTTTNGGAIYNAGTLTLNNCTFTNNTVTGYGGAIYNTGTLNVANCTFASNILTATASVYGGGAIYNTGTISMSNSTFIENISNKKAGAIYNKGILNLSNCSFIGNSAGTSGSAITNSNTLNVTNCTFTSNIGSVISAGGITTYLINCTFTNNTVNCGVIYNTYNVNSVENCTFINNTAISGGAIYNSGTINSVNGCIFIGNTATTSGGAIWSNYLISITNSTFINNTSPMGSTIYCAKGTVSAEYNWWGSNSNPSSQIYGTVDYSNWLYMTLTTDPSTLLNGGNATVTVNFNNIWNGTDVVSIDPASGHIPDGTVVNFSSLLGSFIPVSVTTTNGTATTTFTATATGIDVINATAGSTPVSVNMSVYDVPVADFVANLASGMAPFTAQFTDTSLNVPSSWAWDFDGDGVVDSYLQNPTWTYTASGLYTVVLTVSNAAGNNTVTKTNYISVDLPVANFTANATTGNNSMSVQFTDTSSNSPNSWNWNFGDGTTSTDENPVHTYSKAGTYTVTLDVGNSYGSDSEVKTGYITVVDTIPTVTASVLGGLYNSTQSVELTTDDNTATIYYYLNGNGATYTGPITIDSNSTLVYFALDNMGNFSPMYTQVYTIVPLPVANFSSNVTSGFDSVTVQFNDSSTGIVTGWAWDFNGDGIVDSTEENPIWTYTVAGNYNVTLMVTNIGGYNILSQTGYITVFNSTPPVVTATPDEDAYNSSQSVTLSADQPGCVIYYTTDGSDPTDASNTSRVPYSAPIPINSTTTLNFAAVNAGGVWSSRYNKTYIIDTSLPTVTATPEGGLFNSTQSVVLNATDADTSATAYYTTDGSDPCTSDTRILYTDPITMDTSLTLRYIAVDLAGNWGPEYNQTYVIDLLAPTVNASVTGGTYNTTQSVTLTSDDPTAIIYYAADTTDPRTSSTRVQYTGEITISNTTTLRFAAVDLAGNWSPLYLQNYVIGNGTIPDSTGQSNYTGPQTGVVDWTYTTNGTLKTEYAVVGSDGTIYVGDLNGIFYAINPDGTLKWTFTTGGRIYGGAAIGADGTIYVGSYDGNLYALNPDGTLKWNFTAGTRIYGSPAVGADGTIYVSSYTNSTVSQVYALDENGNVKWSYNTSGYISSGMKFAIASDGTIYFVTSKNILYAMNQDGTVKWSSNINWYYTSPVIGSDGTVYVTSWQTVYAFNPDGTVKWTFSTSINNIYGSVAIASDGTIYVGNSVGYFYALNPDGTQKWVYYINPSSYSNYCIYGTPVVGADGTIYIQTKNSMSSSGSVFAFNSDGTLKWTKITNTVSFVYFTIGSDGTLYATGGSTLYAFKDVLPVANFTANVTTGNNTLTVQFTDSSLHSVSSWAWDFDGDGVVDSTEQNPVYTYTTAGKYNVTLTVGNAVGNNTMTKNSYISVYLDDVYVSPTGSDTNGTGTSSNPYATLQKALDNAITGGTVHLRVGTYTGTGNCGITISRNVTIIGEDSATTIIDAQYLNNIVTINSGVIVSLENLSLVNAHTTSNGGAIYNAGNLTAINCIFANNTVNTDSANGGAIYNTGTIYSLSNCTFNGNAAYYGGAIYNTNGIITSMDNCAFSNNTALLYGGAIYTYGSMVTSINGCTFTGNTLTYQGGAAIYNYKGTITVTNSTFANNTAYYYGGAIYNNAGTMTFTSCSFIGNTVTSTSSAKGGAIYTQSGSITISYSSFINNSAKNGGAIYSGTSSIIVHFSSFVNNTATTSGSSIYRQMATFNAEYNWWGSNSDPSSQIYGTVDYSNWLYMTVTTDPSTLLNGNNATVTASFNNIWNGTDVVGIDPASGHIVDGTVVNFSSLLGSLDHAVVSTVNGVATCVFTALDLGAGFVNATTDSQTVSNNVTVVGIINDRTNATYTSIQAMIDDVNTLAGDTITFYTGTYTENIVLSKSLILIASGVVHLIPLDASQPVLTITSSGSGSVIQGFNISGALNSNGVSMDSTSNVTLVNNTISGNYVGVKFWNSADNTVANNTVTGNAWSGICLDTSNGNTITGNNVFGNQEGVFLANSLGNTITGNNASGNTYTGVTVIGGSDNLVQGNTVQGNGVSGILIQRSTNNNVTVNTVQNNSWSGICLDQTTGTNVSGNTVSGNQEGIFVVDSQGTDIVANSVTNSTFTGISILAGSNDTDIIGNQVGDSGFTGILVQNSNLTTIQGNTLQNNSWSGVCLDQATNTSVIVNNFENNPEQAFAVGGSGNSFDGNYWSDWPYTFARPIDGDNNISDANPQPSPLGMGA